MKKERKTQMEAALEAMPDRPKGMHRKWTPEEDRLILKYSLTKGFEAVAAILKTHGATVRKRFLTLGGGK